MRQGRRRPRRGPASFPAAAGTADGAETGAGILDPVGMMEDPPEKRAIATAVPAVGGTSATISGRETATSELGRNRSRRGGREGHISQVQLAQMMAEQTDKTSPSINA